MKFSRGDNPNGRPRFGAAARWKYVSAALSRSLSSCRPEGSTPGLLAPLTAQVYMDGTRRVATRARATRIAPLPLCAVKRLGMTSSKKGYMAKVGIETEDRGRRHSFFEAFYVEQNRRGYPAMYGQRTHLSRKK